MTSPADNTVLRSPSESVTDDERRQQHILASPSSGRSVRHRNGDTWTSTPRGQRSRSQLSISRSMSKRSGTPALEYLKWNAPESPMSPERSFEHVPGQQHHQEEEEEEDLDFELHADSKSDDGFEGLENVRACCDGKSLFI